MLLIHLLQHCYYLSDPAIECEAVEVPKMCRCAGIDIISNRTPHEIKIYSVRYLLDKKIWQIYFLVVKSNSMAIIQVLSPMPS